MHDALEVNEEILQGAELQTVAMLPTGEVRSTLISIVIGFRKGDVSGA